MLRNRSWVVWIALIVLALAGCANRTAVIRASAAIELSELAAEVDVETVAAIKGWRGLPVTGCA